MVVDLPVDESELRAIERRRAAEAARKSRIFHPRTRVIGVDQRALQKQQEEKRETLEMDAQRDSAYDRLRLSLDEVAMQQKQTEDEFRGELARDLIRFRAIHQRAEDSRDADINYDRKVAPNTRVSVSALGPASMQVFLGEGQNEKEKVRSQMELNERNLRAQREEKEKQEKEEKHKDFLTSLALVEKDLKAAEERMENERQERLKREGAELAELHYMLTSDLLTERPEPAQRITERPLILTDRWKGMTPQQIAEIHRKREEQCFEKQSSREMEKQRDLAWGYHLTEQVRQQEKLEEREKDLRKERRLQLDKYNQQLAREQQAHQDYLDKTLYTNRPTVQYFSQFNTSSR
ncbi:hypothetical protein DNTS_005359 [Danionella cerebrum]|uniref:RIB43A-like with coiled-coils protein 1 n=1 Tax=Danionella cerebrum TaxID=2873325 RepID=A0A553NLZ1_9TELE|nr:hypothetical protein DNTS_005359 [Danionella translucida]